MKIKAEGNMVETDFFWNNHTANWERPRHMTGTANMKVTGNKKGKWLSIHSEERGEKSSRLTMLTLDEPKAIELMNVIMETFHHDYVQLADLCARLNPPKGKNQAEIGAGQLNQIIQLAQSALKGRARIEIENG